MISLKWTESNGRWNAVLHDRKKFSFYVESTIQGYIFSYHGPDGLGPCGSDFSEYFFHDAEDAKDAAHKHFSWLTDENPHRFDGWFLEYSQNL